jgi:hypothetical protein
MASMQVQGGHEPKVVVFPGTAGLAPRLDRGAIATLLGGRVRTLRVVCGAMLGSALLMAAASVVVVRALAAPPEVSTEVSLTLTCAAVVLILVTSRLHVAILARAGRGTSATANPAPAAAAVADAYSRATILSFVILDAAAALGLVVAVVTGSVRYALVICGAAAIAMLARWPQQAAAVRLLKRRGLA